MKLKITAFLLTVTVLLEFVSRHLHKPTRKYYFSDNFENSSDFLENGLHDRFCGK